MLLMNILIGFFALTACLLVQALLLKMAIRYYASEEEHLGDGPWATYRILCSVVMLLVIGNLLQVAVWAVVFIFLGEFSDFATAYYHSAVNFATLGYGDIVMSEKYRLLGPLESINGILMVGITTAALMSVVSQVMKIGLERSDESD
ncbi:MAG: hypothetical protein ACI9NT_000267 [Bacteroidia bacterium]|jgi:hypothetical protein